MSKGAELTTNGRTTSAGMVRFFSQTFFVSVISYLILWVSIVAGSVPYWNVAGPQLDMKIITLFFNVMLGGSANGFFVAFCQEKILKRAGYEIAYWKRYTTLAFTVGWLVFFVAQYALPSRNKDYGMGFYESSMLLSLLFGLSVAVSQWLSMRTHYAHTIHWLWTTAVSWTVGLYLLYPLLGLFAQYWGDDSTTAQILGLVIAVTVPAIVNSLFLLIGLKLMGTPHNESLV